MNHLDGTAYKAMVVFAWFMLTIIAYTAFNHTMSKLENRKTRFNGQ